MFPAIGGVFCVGQAGITLLISCLNLPSLY